MCCLKKAGKAFSGFAGGLEGLGTEGNHYLVSHMMAVVASVPLNWL